MLESLAFLRKQNNFVSFVIIKRGYNVYNIALQTSQYNDNTWLAKHFFFHKKKMRKKKRLELTLFYCPDQEIRLGDP